jgi:MFS family permease
LVHPISANDSAPPGKRLKALRLWLAVGACGLAYFSLGQDGQMVVSTLPRLGRELGLSPTTAVWLVLAASATTAGLMLPIGRWADVSSKRFAFVIGAGGYAISGALAAASPSVAWLLGARALQGAFNALLLVLVVTVAVESAGPKGRAAAVGLLTAIGPFANMTAPQLAAILIPHFGWRSVFLVSVPLCLISAITGWFTLPREGRRAMPRPKWLVEAGAMTLAITSLFFLLRQLPEGGHAVLPAAGLALLCAVGVGVWVQMPQAHGIFRLVLARRMAAPLGALAAMAFTAGVIAFAVPYYLLVNLHATLQVAGLVFISLAFAQTLASVAGGYAIARFGGWPVAMTGAGIMAAGALVTLPLDPNWGPIGIAWRIAVFGIGSGLVGGANQSTVMGLAPWHHGGATSAVSGVSRNLSYAIGAASASTLASILPTPLVGLRWALLATVLVCVGALVASTRLRALLRHLDDIDHHPSPHLSHMPLHRLDGLAAHDPTHPHYKAPERLHLRK